MSGKDLAEYRSERHGKLEYRHFPDGSLTIIDLSRKAGTNRTVGHVGPNAERAEAFALGGVL